MAIINQIMNNGLFITNLNSVCFGINGGNPPVLADNITPIKNYVVSQNGSNCNNIKNYVGSQNGANCNTVNNIQEFVSDGKSMMDNTKDHTRRILSIPKKEEIKTTNIIDYNDYINNPTKYQYQLKNDTPAYVSALYEKYKVFNSNNMQGLLGDKFGSQTTFDDGQRSLIKTLERYYFTVSDDEIAYISSSDGKVYLKNGLLFSIKDGFINSIKDLNVGSEYYLEPNNIYFHKYVDRNNNVEYWMNEGNITNVDIYDSSNLNSYQYGGNQMSFFYHSQDLLNDPYILNNLRSYFPDASMDDYELYLNKLSIKGCGYASTANAIFNQYTGNEQQFLKDFGFPMYSIRDDGSLDYNYEYLMLDFFNYRNIRTGLNIQQLYGNISKTATGEIIEVGFSDVDALGFDNNSYASIKTYLKDRYNIDIRLDERYLNSDLNKDFINSENSFEYDDVVSAYYDIKNDNNTVILGAGNFKLLNMDGSVNLENGDGHCMTITGVTDDGNFIVSSWGEQHIIDIKGTQANGGNIDIHAITFE